MTRYSSEEAYQAALNNPNSIENTMMGGSTGYNILGLNDGPAGGQGIMGGQMYQQGPPKGPFGSGNPFGGVNPFGGLTPTDVGNGLNFPPSIGGMSDGMSDGIQYYLNPFLQKLADQQRDQALTNISREFDNKAEPYMEEVKQLTEDTFPNYTGGGGMGSQGGFRGGFMPQQKIEEPFQQFQGVGIGSLFGSSNNFNPFRS